MKKHLDLGNGTWAIIVDNHVVGWVRLGHCTHPACGKAIESGRPFHAIPRIVTPAWANYHFTTLDEAANKLVEFEAKYEKLFE